MKAELITRNTDLEGQELIFRTKDLQEADKLFADFKGKTYTISREKKKRSLDSNSYCWVLIEKIAQAIHSTREEVYRKAIKEVGRYDDVAVIDKAANGFCEGWSNNGIGWFTETFDSTLKGCKKVRCYYGSSTYDTKEMSRLIDYIVDEAKGLEIETLTPNEIAELNAKWKGASK